MVKSPLSLLGTIRLALVPIIVAVTAAPGTDAPLWSVTVPTRTAVTDWARRAPEARRSKRPVTVSAPATLHVRTLLDTFPSLRGLYVVIIHAPSMAARLPGRSPFEVLGFGAASRKTGTQIA